MTISFIRILNISSDSDRTLQLGNLSWLEYWESKKQENGHYCHAKDCIKPGPYFGVHVVPISPLYESKEYIIPLCADCKRRIGEFEVRDSLVVVPPDLF